MEDGPIFVRGYSRSGGTLLVTILDAHPDIAMSYELYPNLLEPGDGPEVDLEELASKLAAARSLKKVAKEIEPRGLQTFLLRSDRGGLNQHDLAEILRRHRAEGLGFSTPGEHLRFIEKCCRRKMERQGKSRWGAKCNNQYEDYLSVWPDACFLNITRDGRDVLSSQLHTGSFNKTPEEIAKGWVNTYLRFHSLAERPGVRAYQVYYEKLVNDPAGEVRKICEFLGVPFDESMLNFHKHDLTIYNASHLSMKQISKPIDPSRIGRWRTDVTEPQMSEFLATARDAMTLAGYVEQRDADRS